MMKYKLIPYFIGLVAFILILGAIFSRRSEPNESADEAPLPKGDGDKTKEIP